MVQDEGHVGVEVEVFELEIMAFLDAARGVTALRAAVTEGAGQEIALMGQSSFGVAWYFAYSNLFRSNRVCKGHKNRAKDEK